MYIATRAKPVLIHSKLTAALVLTELELRKLTRAHTMAVPGKRLRQSIVLPKSDRYRLVDRRGLGAHAHTHLVRIRIRQEIQRTRVYIDIQIPISRYEATVIILSVCVCKCEWRMR